MNLIHQLQMSWEGKHGFRSNIALCTEFADRMTRAVYGKNKHSHNSSITLFKDLISPILEAFAPAPVQEWV
jgi:hypothetical protein